MLRCAVGSCFVLIVSLHLVASAWAQQPNASRARLVIDGQDGPSWPIMKSVRQGAPITGSLEGLPYARFALAAAARLRQPGRTTMGGQFDLDPQSFLLTIDGWADPLNGSLDPNGRFAWNATVTNQAPVGLLGAVQAALEDPAALAGYRLSAATELRVIQGPTVRVLNLANDSFLPVLLPTGWVAPFYGTSYTYFFVGSNGTVSFEGGIADASPTPAELRAGPPAIAAFWANLDPALAGTVQVTFDPLPAPWMRVDFLDVPDAGGTAGTITGTLHTFSLRMDLSTVPGEFALEYAVRHAASTYPTVVGFSPGRGRDASSALTDLSPLIAAPAPTAGAALQGFVEWFGDTYMTGYGLSFPNPFDLTALALSARPLGAADRYEVH